MGLMNRDILTELLKELRMVLLTGGVTSEKLERELRAALESVCRASPCSAGRLLMPPLVVDRCPDLPPRLPDCAASGPPGNEGSWTDAAPSLRCHCMRGIDHDFNCTGQDCDGYCWPPKPECPVCHGRGWLRTTCGGWGTPAERGAVWYCMPVSQ